MGRTVPTPAPAPALALAQAQAVHPVKVQLSVCSTLCVCVHCWMGSHIHVNILPVRITRAATHTAALTSGSGALGLAYLKVKVLIDLLVVALCRCLICVVAPLISLAVNLLPPLPVVDHIYPRDSYVYCWWCCQYEQLTTSCTCVRSHGAFVLAIQRFLEVQILD